MRRFSVLSLLLLALTCSPATLAKGPYFANGIKVGEATTSRVIVWTRLTAIPQGDFTQERDTAPGMSGEVRVTYWKEGQTSKKFVTDWQKVDPKKDFTWQFTLTEGIEAGTTYELQAEARASASAKPSCSLAGEFKTPPDKETAAPVKFAVVTCQSLRSNDLGDDGFAAYANLNTKRPDFFVHTGDIVYYDKTPLCKNAAQARQKWNTMYAYSELVKFHNQTTSYFEKDDHDTLKNDCSPGQTYGDLTFDEGLGIFREQVPMGEKTYRTIRWGKDLQIWLTENRDFRSPNKSKDGPEKTILGKEQKEWLFKTVRESDATFKLLISPGCIVGPDKKGKNDNHANAAFLHEGQQLRDLVASEPNMFIVNGDRHWQYHSIDPKTKAREFGCGPIGDLHTYGGNCGNNPKFHQFFSTGGGFLWITVERPKEEEGKPQISFQFHGAEKNLRSGKSLMRKEFVFPAKK